MQNMQAKSKRQKLCHATYLEIQDQTLHQTLLAIGKPDTTTAIGNKEGMVFRNALLHCHLKSPILSA
jgi:hypothetical protein